MKQHHMVAFVAGRRDLPELEGDKRRAKLLRAVQGALTADDQARCLYSDPASLFARHPVRGFSLHPSRFCNTGQAFVRCTGHAASAQRLGQDRNDRRMIPTVRLCPSPSQWLPPHRFESLQKSTR